MSHEGFTAQHRTIGRAAAWAVFFLAVVYAVPLVLGLLHYGTAHFPHGTIDGREHGRSSRLRTSWGQDI